MNPQNPPPPHFPGSKSVAAPARGQDAGTSGHRRLWLNRGDGDGADGGESFDALTDLFLGEIGRHRRETPTAETSARESRPVLRLAGTGQNDEVETAADLIEEEAASVPVSSQTEPARPPLVECLVVGNLPVLASAWASQYVREVARASGCAVAFLRSQAGFVTLELVGERNESNESRDAEASADLDAGLKAAVRATHRWVVRVDPGDETSAAARESMRLLTLITGPDDAARLNAYGTLKELAARLPKDAGGPMVRVAVMSTSVEQADAAGRKVVDTVRQHLGREVQHAVCSSKIAASRPARMLFNGKLDCSVGAILERLETALGATVATDLRPTASVAATAAIPAMAEPAVSAAVEEQPAGATTMVEASVSAPVTAARVETRHAEVERKPMIAAVPHETSERVNVLAPEIPSVVDEILESPSVNADIRRREPAVVALEPASPRHEAISGRVDDVALWAAGATGEEELAPKLVRLISGLSESAARCPYAENVEIGVDSAGRVHLLARSGDAHDHDRALAGLMVAAAWLDSHASMLATIDPRLKHRTGTRVLHLFTATPKTSRRLLETDVRVHVLSPVNVGGRVGWCCLELN